MYNNILRYEIKHLGNKDHIETMAAVDSFDFLLKEIVEYFKQIRDVFALIGALYVANKSLKISWTILKALNAHVFSRLSQKCDLPEKFGLWAG